MDFDAKTKEECWKQAPPVPGRDPTRWRYDAPLERQLWKNYMEKSSMGFAPGMQMTSYPKASRVLVIMSNCQILSSLVNKRKEKMTLTKEGDEAAEKCWRQQDKTSRKFSTTQEQDIFPWRALELVIK